MTRLPHVLFCLLITFIFVREVSAQEEGMASYYHDKFHGRKMSSGRIHSQDELIAAHRTLPFGTFVRVTNLKNMKSVITCIADRGPFRKGWIIDVSSEAAERLDFIRRGITKVRVEVVPGPLDLRYLDLIYPQLPPYLDNSRIQPRIPLKLDVKKQEPFRKKHKKSQL